MDTASQIAQAQDALQKELRRLVELAPPAPSNETPPPQQAVQLARLHAAQAALRLAAALLRADDPAAAQALDDELRQLDQQVKAWKRKGQGWFETRMVRGRRLLTSETLPASVKSGRLPIQCVPADAMDEAD